MSAKDLFGSHPQASKPARAKDGAARVKRAERRQVELRPCSLEELLPEDHRARLLWRASEKLDLSLFYRSIESREGSAGAPAIDPQILVVLWLYATSEGVGSAREIERLTRSHDAYRWICGGVSVNHHTLSDFRVAHERALDQLMSEILGVLMHQGLLTLDRVAQDGTRVRASAGAASFRREKSLRGCLDAAKARVRATKELLEREEGGRLAPRRKSAMLRAAKQREERLERALQAMEKLRAARPASEHEELRVSSSDPQARVMKMADGGFRPAYNLQFATDTASRVIVGVSVTTKGNDQGEIAPMLEQLERRTKRRPREHLVDAGYMKLSEIEAVGEKGTALLAPPLKPCGSTRDPFQPLATDTPMVAAWRRRMGSEEAKQRYKERAATAETTNADLRTWRGLDRLHVRGSGKVLCVALWAALTYNLMRCMSLGVM